jgi:hypothetical protein
VDDAVGRRNSLSCEACRAFQLIHKVTTLDKQAFSQGLDLPGPERLGPRIDERPLFGIMEPKMPTYVNTLAQQTCEVHSTYIYSGGLRRGSR